VWSLEGYRHLLRQARTLSLLCPSLRYVPNAIEISFHGSLDCMQSGYFTRMNLCAVKMLQVLVRPVALRLQQCYN
ncbi:hypothetical protein PFISCL1PPCAC_22966, partial [Pristionchus fissidentatus]